MQRVYLRALEIDDLERTQRWHNDPTLYETMVGAFRFVSRAAEEQWLRQKTAFSDDEVNLAICLTDGAEHVGNIYLRHIDWIARCAEVSGLFIGERQQRRRGYASEALRLLVTHAFADLGLQRLYAFVLAENQAIHQVVQNCGFVVEGALRRHTFKRGEFKDVLLVALVASKERDER